MQQMMISESPAALGRRRLRELLDRADRAEAEVEATGLAHERAKEAYAQALAELGPIGPAGGVASHLAPGVTKNVTPGVVPLGDEVTTLTGPPSLIRAAQHMSAAALESGASEELAEDDDGAGEGRGLHGEPSFAAWAANVRDPASKATEGVRAFESVKGKQAAKSARAEYEVAPLPDGRWAIRDRFQWSPANGSSSPWIAHPSRADAVESFRREALRFFGGDARDGQPGWKKQQAAMLEMLKGDIDPRATQNVAPAATPTAEQELAAMGLLPPPAEQTPPPPREPAPRIWPAKGTPERATAAVQEATKRGRAKFEAMRLVGASDEDLAAALCDMFGGTPDSSNLGGGVTHPGDDGLSWWATSRDGVPMLWVDCKPGFGREATLAGPALVARVRKDLGVPKPKAKKQPKKKAEPAAPSAPAPTPHGPCPDCGAERQERSGGPWCRACGLGGYEALRREAEAAAGERLAAAEPPENLPPTVTAPHKQPCAVCGQCRELAPTAAKCPDCLRATDRGTLIWREGDRRASYRLYLLPDRAYAVAGQDDLGNWGEDGLDDPDRWPSLAQLSAHASRAAGCELEARDVYDFDGKVGVEFERPEARPAVPKGELFAVPDRAKTVQEDRL